MSSMLTRSGRMVDLLNVTPGDINIEDIAHSLSQICRFTGHTRRHYSVAEHSINVAKLLPQPIKIYGLLHDAHEAYIGDLSTPLKIALWQAYANTGVNGDFDYLLERIETPILCAIYEALGVPYPSQLIKDAVKYADTTMAVVEMKQLFNKWPPAGQWGIDENLPLPDLIIPIDYPYDEPTQATAEGFVACVTRCLKRDVANKVAA